MQISKKIKLKSERPDKTSGLSCKKSAINLSFTSHLTEIVVNLLLLKAARLRGHTI